MLASINDKTKVNFEGLAPYPVCRDKEYLVLLLPVLLYQWSKIYKNKITQVSL